MIILAEKASITKFSSALQLIELYENSILNWYKMNAFFRGFRFAFNGIAVLIKTGLNFKIQLIAFCFVCFAGFYFKITSTEWLMIMGVSALVLSLEALNTSIEKLCDLYSTEQNDKIKIIKDIAAGAVLIASFFAGIVGVLIFWKYII